MSNELTLSFSPNIALLLVMAGSLGIYVEFCAPGLIFAGVAGSAISLLGIASLAPLPVNPVGVLLILLAPGLFFWGAKSGKNKLLTAAGLLSMMAGAKILIDSPNIGSPQADLRIRWITVAAIVPFALITNFLISIAVRARRNKRIPLTVEKTPVIFPAPIDILKS